MEAMQAVRIFTKEGDFEQLRRGKASRKTAIKTRGFSELNQWASNPNPWSDSKKKLQINYERLAGAEQHFVLPAIDP